MTRLWPLLLAFLVAVPAVYVWAQIIGPVGIVALAAIALAVANGGVLGFPRRRR